MCSILSEVVTAECIQILCLVIFLGTINNGMNIPFITSKLGPLVNLLHHFVSVLKSLMLLLLPDHLKL